MYSKLLKASNSKSLVNEAYLIVEEGYKTAPSEHLKYPHHKIVGEQLVVDEAGVIAAFQRASQQGIVRGNVKEHLLKHYKELGLSTENFEEKEVKAELETEDLKEDVSLETKSEEVETEVIENEKEPEEAENCEVEAEVEEEEKETEPESEEVEAEAEIEDDKAEPEEEVDYEAIIAEYENKIANMEEEKKVYMTELEELRKYKEDRENSDKEFAIEEVFSQIVEVMPQDKMDSLREEAKDIKFENIDAFKNKVKAMAFEFSAKGSNKSEDRMAIINVEPVKKEKRFDWGI